MLLKEWQVSSLHILKVSIEIKFPPSWIYGLLLQVSSNHILQGILILTWITILNKFNNKKYIF